MTTGPWTSREDLVHRVVTLDGDGLSARAIARALGISRNTVKDVIEAHRAARSAEHSALSPAATRMPRAKKTDSYVPRIHELLKTYPDITAQRVFEILRAEGFDGGYTAVKKRLRGLRPVKKPAPSLTAPAYGPGEMAESDWSPFTPKLTSGEEIDVEAFGYTLPFSTRKYFGLYERNDLHALMDGHEQAFERFKGCAARCKYDSQKPVVLRWEGAQPIYNPRFLAFAAHYEFRPRAVRGQPNAKPRVERSFWEMVRSFLNGRSFRDLDDMRLQLADWLDTIVDQRRRRQDARTPLERFAEERDHLVPLPRHPYDTARVVYRVCSIDGFVDWEGNRYAVPYDHITDLLPVRVTQREIVVYAADLECIARHELAPRGAGRVVDPEGLHPPARRKRALDLDQLAGAFDRIGEGAAAFFRLMSTGPPRVWAHHARCILVLRARFETKDLDAALVHAARFGAFDHHAVERILEARAVPRTLDEYVAEDTARRLQDGLVERATEPRDLTEYDRLPGARSSVDGTPPATSDPPPGEESQCKNEAPNLETTPPPATGISSSSDSDATSGSSA